MIASYLLSLREGIEAALIIGIVLGVLGKINRAPLKSAVWHGTLSAAVFSLLAALALNLLGTKFEGRAEEIYEGVTMLLAAGLLSWMIFWMQRQSTGLRHQIEQDVNQAVSFTGRRALFVLAFLTISREGLELALFLTASSFTTTDWHILVGAFLGLATAAILGWLFFTSSHRLSLHTFFRLTNVLLILFAAGMVAYGVHEFNEAGVIPGVIEHIWNTNSLLDENSTLGMFFKTLLGYNGNPSLTEVLAYIFYLIAIILGIRYSAPRSTQNAMNYN